MFRDGECTGLRRSVLVNVVAEGFWQSTSPDKGAAKPDHSDGRKLIYSLTAKGIDLAPVLTEMVLWAARHERTENRALIHLMRKDTKQFNAKSASAEPPSAPIRPQLKLITPEHEPETFRAFTSSL